jgi:hypothetical protein
MTILQHGGADFLDCPRRGNSHPISVVLFPNSAAQGLRPQTWNKETRNEETRKRETWKAAIITSTALRGLATVVGVWADSVAPKIKLSVRRIRKLRKQMIAEGAQARQRVTQ